MRIVFVIVTMLTALSLSAQSIPDNPNLSDSLGRQGAWTILYDEHWNEIASTDEAFFYRIINYQDNLPIGIVKDYFISGKIQMEALLKSDRPDVMDGLVKLYNEDGSIDNMQFYQGRRSLDESIELLTSDTIVSENIEGILALAGLYHANRMKEARPLYQEYLKMVKKEKGDTSLLYANALRHLAWDHLRHFDYINAEPLFFQAKSIIDSKKWEDMRAYALILNDIGDYYTHINRHEEGLKYFTEAQEVAEKHTPKNDYLRFVIIHNSASCYRAAGDYQKALELSKKAVADAYERFGKYHRETANVSKSLSYAYQGLGNADKAKELLYEVSEIYSELYSGTHNEYLGVLYEIGKLHVNERNFQEASKIYKEVYGKYKVIYGDLHPHTTQVQRSYALSLYRMGRKSEAIDILRNSAASKQTYLHQYFDYMNEDARANYYKGLLGFSYFQSSLTAAEREGYPELTTDLLNMQLRNKALLISTTNSIKKRILESNDRKLIELYNEAQELKQQLESLRNLSDEEIWQKHQLKRDSLFEALENKDRDLNRLSSVYSVNNQPPHWHSIRDKLIKDEALVEIRRYREFDLENWKWSTNIRYMAFIVTSKTKDQPMVVSFDNGNYLEEKGIAYYTNNIKHKTEDRKSYNHYWKPLEKALKKYSKVYFSADGIFHKVNLQTLYNPDNEKFLMDEMDIQLVTSGRDLLEVQPEASPVKIGMLLGNPSFGDVPEGASGTSRAIEMFSLNNERSGIANLPGAEEEVIAVAKLLNNNGWKSIVLTNEDAEESALKDMLKPNILHIATHGFFNEDKEEDSDPLHNTGLLFTGAAKSLYESKNTNSANDGLLTSFEAINLNIDNTSLVVLSACETGLGELQNGEGIYGLQRAFKIAGARTIIMSLWKIDDAATSQLMTVFYENWLGSNLTKRQAFKEAQNQLKKDYPHPYYWGAFVVLGE